MTASTPALDRNQNRPVPKATKSTIAPLAAGASTTQATTDAFAEHTYYYILVPAVALIAVAIIALLIFLLVRYQRRKTNAHIRLPVYHYDPQDESGWESELLDDSDPPFVRDNQRPIVSLSIQPDTSNNTTSKGNGAATVTV